MTPPQRRRLEHELVRFTEMLVIATATCAALASILGA